MKINPEKIRDVIGKGGATIRALTEETGCTIDIGEDGTITIASTDADKAEHAKQRITEITAEAEIGKVYEGPITKILDFGALVNILPGKDGLLHISQIAHQRVENVTDFLHRRPGRQGQGAGDRREGPHQAQHEGPARAPRRHGRRALRAAAVTVATARRAATATTARAASAATVTIVRRVMRRPAAPADSRPPAARRGAGQQPESAAPGMRAIEITAPGGPEVLQPCDSARARAARRVNC